VYGSSNEDMEKFSAATVVLDIQFEDPGHQTFPIFQTSYSRTSMVILKILQNSKVHVAMFKRALKPEALYMLISSSFFLMRNCFLLDHYQKWRAILSLAVSDFLFSKFEATFHS
jgi:hypothetical protein